MKLLKWSIQFLDSIWKINRMKKVVVFGIDNFSYKNRCQVKCLNENKFNAYIFTNDSLKNSSKNLDRNNTLYILRKSFFERINQIYFFLKRNKKDIHHVEIYPAGRFSFLYILLAKVFRVKSITVDRGDICTYKNANIFTKFSMRFCYKYSDIVWYRESYSHLDVKKQLYKWGAKRIFFIPNAAPEITVEKQNQTKKYLFLWVNRFLEERKVKWFVDSVNELKNSKSIMLGLMDLYDNEKYAKLNQSEYLKVYNYQNPKDFYLKSKFFVFPSDVVFLNNALLESMSYGLVPLISDVLGSNLIVDDGINGFVFKHKKEALKDVMKKAIELSDEKYELMSKNAIKKVKENFSYSVWSKKYLSMIDNLTITNNNK